LAGLILGKSPAEYGRHFQSMCAAVGYDRRGASMMAISAIDIALHDLAAQMLGISVAALMGGAVRNEVLAYASGPFVRMQPDPYREYQREVDQCLSLNFKAIKPRGGVEPRADGIMANISQRFTRGILGAAPSASLAPPPTPTRDLIGTRAIYRYSEDTIYEHIYLNTGWYAYQYLKGLRRGDCGADETSYWKIRDGVYVVTWREILIDLAAVFVYDMATRRSTGCAWGTPGRILEPRHILTGALFEKLNDAGYPADLELV
jgi:hypothetical protein